jgi:hypothetical protein
MLKKLWSWWTEKSKRDQLLDVIDNARLFEEWDGAAYSLDECMDYDMWYASVSSLIKPASLYVHELTHNAGDKAPRASITITASSTNASRPSTRPKKRAISSTSSISSEAVSSVILGT